MFERYQLGLCLPNLRILEKAAETEIRLNTIKNEYVKDMQSSAKKASEKIEILEKKVETKFYSEEIKRKVHLTFIVLLGVLALLEKFKKGFYQG